MRAPLTFIAALVFIFVASVELPADPARELIVAVAPPAPRARADATPARLVTRLADLRLVLVRTLADGLPPRVVSPDPARVRQPGSSDSNARLNPFDLDPSRVLLVAVPDSATAASALAALARDPDVAWAEPNRVRIACGAVTPFPNDPLFQSNRQWALRNLGASGPFGGNAGADIHALEAWRQCVGSNDLILAIADTGIDPSHPDLAAVFPDGHPRVMPGLNVTLDPSGAVTDSFGHGILVAGVMAARTHDGAHFDSLGMAGVCGGDGAANFGCRILPIKIARGHTGVATSFDIARGIVYAVSQDARALNLSFASSGASRLERSALYYAIARGCVVVAAAGNRGSSAGATPQYPAAYAADGLCLQVGASDPSDLRAAFSSYGPGLDVIAPGVDVWTTFMTYPSFAGASYPGYVPASGTSLAAPHATGVVGLLAAARPELDAADFQRLLRESADDVGEPGMDRETGYGRLNATAALEAVRPALGIWHDEVLADQLRPIDVDTLRVGEDGPGTMDRVRLWPRAERIEATARVALPDSFLDSIRVWPRAGGTFTVRGGFQLPYFAPWAEVMAADDRSFTLRGYLYRTLDSAITDGDAYLPLPPDQARFGFTVIGRVDRPPTLELLAPAPGTSASPGETLHVAWHAHDPDEVSAIEVWLELEHRLPVRMARLPGTVERFALETPCVGAAGGRCRVRVAALDEHGRQHDRTEAFVGFSVRPGRCPALAASAQRIDVSPHPVRGMAHVVGPPGAGVRIVDLAGRLVRRATLDRISGVWVWDGCDERGRRAPPGVYRLRIAGGTGMLERMVVCLQ